MTYCFNGAVRKERNNSNWKFKIIGLYEKKMDLVSVIVAVYNAEKYIEKCVDSILSQTYENIEVILVDDGSTDNSPLLCDRYERNDCRVHVIHKINGGLCDARNTGVRYSKGKYITFVDNDDIVNNEFIETLYNICEEYNCDIAMCDYLMTNEKSSLLPPQQTFSVKVYNQKEIFKEFFKESNLVRFWVSWDKMYRRELFDEIQYPIGRIHDDMFTTHKLFGKAEKIAVTNKYLYYYFQREGSITGRNNTIEERIDVIEAIKEEVLFLKDNEFDDEYAFMLLKLYHMVCTVVKNREEYDGYFAKKEHYDNVMDEFAIESEIIKKEYMELPTIGMKSKILSIACWLSAAEKEKYKNIYGIKFPDGTKPFYEFPKRYIRKNELIAIYGAGTVGQSFYEQVTQTGYCRVAAWVDNGFKNYIRNGLPVQPIDELLNCEYDKIVIAVLNRNIAYDIERNLKEWGIEASKIIALPAAVERADKMLSEFRNDTNIIKSSSNKRRFFLLNTPDHDNLGDHLLTLGAISYLNDYFPEEEVVEITGRQWDACRESILTKISPKDVIFIVGGGYMGDLWPVQDKRVKDIIEAFIYNRIVFLPQTFFYKNNSVEEIDFDIEFYKKVKKVLFIHREKQSYSFFKSNIAPEHRNVCFPDTALYLNQRQHCLNREGGLICLRLDKEAQHNDFRERIYEDVNLICHKVGVIDTVLQKSVLRSERVIEVDKMLGLISGAEILITDRLHAMVMAIITGTPCIALDNLSKKVSGVYEWIKDLDYVKCVSEDEISKELICEFISKRKNNYDKSIVKHQFDLMYETIIDWLE